MARRHANYASSKLAKSIGPNLEAWVRRMLVSEIEAAYRETLLSDTLNYYYVTCSSKTDEDGRITDTRCRTVWCGPGLLKFIRTLLRRKVEYVGLYVTSSPNKSGIVDQFHGYAEGHRIRDVEETNMMWIGDTAEAGRMCCCNDAWIHLWTHVRDKKARPSADERNHGFPFEL